MNKLLAALAKGYFAISEEGVHGYFPLAQSIMRGSHVPQPVKLADDDFEPAYDDGDGDTCPDDTPTTQQDDQYTGRIAVMRVTGVLMHYGGACSYGTEDYANRINQYAMDDSIAGLIILADTPGGQVDGIETLRLAVVNFREKKPLITLVNDGCLASGGVWGFGASTEIYSANTISMIGSVGVMCTLMDIRKALEKNGIRQVIIRAPQSVDKGKAYSDALDGKEAQLLAELEFLCNRFIEVVQIDRAGKLTSDEWNTGKMFFAADAQRIGLIDGIKSYAEVVGRIQELIAQNQNQDKMFGNKLPKVAALKDAATITATDLEAANEEISAFGINGVTLCLDTELESISANANKLAGLESSITAKDGEIATLTEKVIALGAKLAGKPAEEPKSPAAQQDNIPGTETELAYEPTSVDLEKARQNALWNN